MIRVSLEVREEGNRLRAEVQAESIEQAVRLTVARYPGCEARVLFPIDLKTFFAAGDDPTLTTWSEVETGVDARRLYGRRLCAYLRFRHVRKG